MKFLTIKEELQFAKKKYKTMRRIEDIFLQNGCFQMEAAIFEDYDIVKQFGNPRSFVKLVTGNEIKVLRPDITTNIMRNIIPKIEPNESYKLFYDGTVFRSNASGMIKTTREMGVEWIGNGSIDADKDTILLALQVLETFGDEFVVEVGNSKFVDLILKDLEVSVKEEIKSLIQEKNTSILQKRVNELVLSEETKQVLEIVLSLEGSMKDIKDNLEGLVLSPDIKQVIEEMTKLEQVILRSGYTKRVQFDLAMVAEWNYYDGVIFQGYMNGTYREILKGGRYDSLTKTFGQKVPAIGFMIDLERLVKIGDEVSV